MTTSTATKFTAALEGKNTGCPPIWLMRQAGRWLPEYKKIREKHSFSEMVKNPEIAAKVTLQPLIRYSFDAAIVFSDILVVPESMGMRLQFVDSVGPVFENPLRKAEQVSQLLPFEKERLQYVQETIKLVRQETDAPVLGFAGAPYTVASYMIEGKSDRSFSHTKTWLYQDPSSFCTLLDTICDATISYLHMQAKAGVAAVQIFESWADALSEEAFKKFSLPYLQKIEKAMQKINMPMITFSRGSSHLYPLLSQGLQGPLSIEWQVPLEKVRAHVGKGRVLQGNLDPAVLLTDQETVKRETKKILHAMKDDQAFIFNLGHGTLPGSSLSAVHALIETVRL